MADSSYYQGEYIRHPVLYELSHKYGLQTESVPEAALPNKLEELKELIRREIRKELKIKEGAEKLREASKDRKSLSDVAHIVKKSNSKLSELHAELQELESQIILTQGQGEPPKNGHDCIVSSMSGLNVDSQGNNFSTDLRLVSLEKQLNIELKVKQGAENMLQSLANSGHSRDKKLIGEAQQMLADSKAKIEYLKMRIMKVRQNRGSPRGNDNLPNGDVNNKGRALEPPALEDRVEELRHRLRIEAAVVEGAKNVIRLLQSSKVADKKALQEAGNVLLTANEGPSRDSGYSSEHVSPRGVVGARATCSVTVAGHHTVTLTCSEIPEQVTAPGTTLVPQTVHFCHHPPPDKPHRHFHPHPAPPTPASQQPASQSPQQVPSGPPTPQQEALPPLPVLKDAASQTSSTNIPQVVQEHIKKRKIRSYRQSPARTRSSPIRNKSTGSSGGSDGQKNPRTVHIDVYCTGSESDGSSSSEEEDTNSTPQTVFESNKVKVMHSRAHSDSLPHALQRQKRRVLSNSRLDVLPKDVSDSTISTSYPSPRSSLVSNTTGGFSLASESTLSSRFSSMNNSSVTTSWKDTDLESTQASLLKSDSFDYENSFDKLRIKEKEKMWGTADRPKRFYKRVAQANSNSSDSTDEDEEGLAWSFGRYEDIQKRHLKREETVRYQSQTSEAPCTDKPDSGHKKPSIRKQVPSSLRKSGSLSDSEASNLKKLKNGNAAGRPPPAYPFQHWAKAERFGPLVSSLKKPGHHVGPSKNPDCSCDTCKYFFEHICYRNRTRSLGDKAPY